MTTANLAAIVVISLLLGATFAVYGIRLLAWSDRRWPVSDDEIDEYREVGR